jgi:hypothetical protein
MTPEAVANAVSQRQKEIESLELLWNSYFPGLSVGRQQFGLWLRLHPFSRVVYSIERGSQKFAALNGQMSLDHATRFVSKIANNRKTQEEQRTAGEYAYAR